MGRKSRSFKFVGKIPYCKNPDVLKSRHRFSDSKYRQNVHFLYELLKENTHPNISKDSILNIISSDMKKFHSEMVSLIGAQEMRKLNETFLEVVKIGENMWRKEKILVLWWEQMQEILKDMVSMVVNDEFRKSFTEKCHQGFLVSLK